MLAQEPWCFHPEQIATLTDWQIEHLYARPAIERAKKWKSHEREDWHEAPGTFEPPAPPQVPASPDGEPDLNDPALKEYVISQFVEWGMTRQAAERQFEEQARQPR